MKAAVFQISPIVLNKFATWYKLKVFYYSSAYVNNSTGSYVSDILENTNQPKFSKTVELVSEHTNHTATSSPLK